MFLIQGLCDYEKRSTGVAILHDGKIVSGASPYAVYNGGIEIEIAQNQNIGIEVCDIYICIFLNKQAVY